MSNLLISYPSIPLEAVESLNSVAYNEDFNYRNLISTERHAWAEATAGASGTINNEYDLGVGKTKAVDHIIVARADSLIAQGTTTLRLSTTTAIGGTYADVLTDASFASATLRGSNSQDYIQHSLNLAAARTWRAQITGGGTTSRSYSKLYFGTAFDPVVNVSNFNYTRNDIAGDFKAGSGSVFLYKLSDARYSIEIEWRKITTAKMREFFSTVGRYWDKHRFFLFTTSEHQILDYKRLMHVKMTEAPEHEMIKDKDGYHVISCKFEEVLG